MSKKLIDEMKKADTSLTTDKANQAIEAVVQAVTSLTNSGERVTIRGFGTFQSKVRGERVGRNPRTGEPVKIQARNALTFKEAR